MKLTDYLILANGAATKEGIRSEIQANLQSQRSTGKGSKASRTALNRFDILLPISIPVLAPQRLPEVIRINSAY